MNTIYRIQDADGRGPYCGKCNTLGIFADEQRHPGPQRDSKLCETAKHLFHKDSHSTRLVAPEFIFGYSSLDQLRAWFYKDEPLYFLHENNYSLFHLEGECYHGNSQAIINKTTMRVLSKTSLLTLLGATTLNAKKQTQTHA